MYALPVSDEVPEDYRELDLVCVKADGSYVASEQVASMCRTAANKIEGLEGFHFHLLRHTYTSNLLANGAAPKDVQELLGHSDVSTTMNVYAHATREAKRSSAKLLDIILAMFDVLMDIYKSAGYGDREVAFIIVEHNLHGLDIDKRAYQLAYFAVMMKGR